MTIKRILPIAFILMALPAVWGADEQNGQWVLEKSTLTYHVVHPLHEVDGVSRAARGKGVCQSGQCQFLIAAPLKSFDSGDSNRDLHMLQVVRGAEFPLVTVRTSLPEASTEGSNVRTDLQIEFAGQTATYKQVQFHEKKKGNEVEITGTIPATLSDFKIPPPKLLTFPVKNELPIDVDLTWKFVAVK